MRSKTAEWFDCKVQYDQVQENGLQKKVTEQYVVNALSFAEAEARITEEMSAYMIGEFDVKGIKPAPYKEIFFMSDVESTFQNEVEDLHRALQKGDRAKADEVFHRPLEKQTNTETHWYKAKLQFITLDEKTGKEKRQNVTYLVEACSLHNALDNIDIVMRGTMVDYVQANVGETQIVEVFDEPSSSSKAAELMERMAEDLKDPSKSVEEIADKYVSTATPELRQQLIEKLTDMRNGKHNIG